MTIKKPMKTPTVVANTPADIPELPAAGGATIADRFKLDVNEAPKKSAGGGKSAQIALIVALAALAVAGVLAFTLYQHWEFLKGA